MSSSMQRKRATRRGSGVAIIACYYSLALRIPARPPFDDDVRRTLSLISSSSSEHDNRVCLGEGRMHKQIVYLSSKTTSSAAIDE